MAVCAAGVEVSCSRCGRCGRRQRIRLADFAELVCSNSLKSDSENTAPWLLKEEMRRAGSLLLQIARDGAGSSRSRAGGGSRHVCCSRDRSDLPRASRITVRREEVTTVDEGRDVTIIATGPLTSEGLAEEIARLSAGVEDADADQAGARPDRARICTFTIRSARS